MLQPNDLQRQALSSLLTPRLLLKQSRLSHQPRPQLVKVSPSLSLLVTDTESHSSIEFRLQNIDYMRLKKEMVMGVEREKLVIQAGGRRMVLFQEREEEGERERDGEEIVREVFEALSVLLDI